MAEEKKTPDAKKTSDVKKTAVAKKTADLEKPAVAKKTADEKKGKNVESFTIEQEFLLNAPRARVFEALTAEIGRWWAYRFAGKGSTVSLEPKLGGLFYEDFGGGQGAIYGTVVYLKRPEKIRLAGPLGSSKAVTGAYTYELEEKDGKTLLRISHQASGFFDTEARKSYTVGWQELLGKFLKAWVEEGKRYDQVAAKKES